MVDGIDGRGYLPDWGIGHSYDASITVRHRGAHVASVHSGDATLAGVLAAVDEHAAECTCPEPDVTLGDLLRMSVGGRPTAPAATEQAVWTLVAGVDPSRQDVELYHHVTYVAELETPTLADVLRAIEGHTADCTCPPTTAAEWEARQHAAAVFRAHEATLDLSVLDYLDEQGIANEELAARISDLAHAAACTCHDRVNRVPAPIDDDERTARQHAEAIIHARATDVEYLSITEYLYNKEIEDEDNALAERIDALIGSATVTVTWPDTKETP